MLLDNLKSNELIGIKPHSLRTGDLKAGKISNDLIGELTTFKKDICEKAKIISDSNPNLSKQEIIAELTPHRDKFASIRGKITSEVHDKNRRMRLFPAEYVESIYIISYYLADKCGLSQKDVAGLLDLNERDYKNRWGISPVMDCKARNSSYEYKLPWDTKIEYLSAIIPWLGGVSAEISNIFFLGVSNDISILANIPCFNKMLNKGSFRGRSFYYAIHSIEDFYNFVFIENFRRHLVELKDKASIFVDVNDKLMSEKIMENLIRNGYKIEDKYLDEGSEYARGDGVQKLQDELIEELEESIDLEDTKKDDRGDYIEWKYRKEIEELAKVGEEEQEKFLEEKINANKEERSNRAKYLAMDIAIKIGAMFRVRKN